MGQLYSSPGSGVERRETNPNYKTYERRLCLLIVCIATLVLGLFGTALYLTSFQEESGPPQIIFSEELNLSSLIDPGQVMPQQSHMVSMKVIW